MTEILLVEFWCFLFAILVGYGLLQFFPKSTRKQSQRQKLFSAFVGISLFYAVRLVAFVVIWVLKIIFHL
jgi:hypothetical protein